MGIQVIAVGKLRNRAMQMSADEYIKRLKRYTRAEMIEVRAARKIEAQNTAPALAEEAKNLLAPTHAQTTLVMLDERGEQWTSVELSKWIQQQMVHGQSDMAFLIGGALGFDPALRKRARRVVSLSKMTLPHELARVVLLEQLYRAMTIARNEPYHKP